MQTAALEALGLAGEWTYEAIEVAPDEFEARVRGLPDEGFVGVNVTVPHKLAALAVAERASPAARAIGAANTLSFDHRGAFADNTDAPGLVSALPEPPASRRALVLGAGGAGRACAWALREAGAEVTVWNRTRSRAEELAADLGISIWTPGTSDERRATGDFDLLVNATTVGMAEASAAPGSRTDAGTNLKALPLDADALEARHVVVDLVYGPATTPLIRIARERGARVVDGVEVLVRQGAASLRLWTGLDPPVDVMRAAASTT